MHGLSCMRSHCISGKKPSPDQSGLRCALEDTPASNLRVSRTVRFDSRHMLHSASRLALRRFAASPDRARIVAYAVHQTKGYARTSCIGASAGVLCRGHPSCWGAIPCMSSSTDCSCVLGLICSSPSGSWRGFDSVKMGLSIETPVEVRSGMRVARAHSSRCPGCAGDFTTRLVQDAYAGCVIVGPQREQRLRRHQRQRHVILCRHSRNSPPQRERYDEPSPSPPCPPSICHATLLPWR